MFFRLNDFVSIIIIIIEHLASTIKVHYKWIYVLWIYVNLLWHFELVIIIIFFMLYFKFQIVTWCTMHECITKKKGNLVNWNEFDGLIHILLLCTVLCLIYGILHLTSKRKIFWTIEYDCYVIVVCTMISRGDLDDTYY